MELPTVNNKKENSEIKKRLKVEEVWKEKKKMIVIESLLFAATKNSDENQAWAKRLPIKNNAIHTKNVIL